MTGVQTCALPISFIFTAEVAVRPEVALGEYKGISVMKANAEVSDEEVDQVVERERGQNARSIVVEDRGAENGDTVVIDYEGFMDGVAFDGGKGEKHPLELGSHSFIDTFEEQLIGKKSGEVTLYSFDPRAEAAGGEEFGVYLRFGIQDYTAADRFAQDYKKEGAQIGRLLGRNDMGLFKKDANLPWLKELIRKTLEAPNHWYTTFELSVLIKIPEEAPPSWTAVSPDIGAENSETKDYNY